MLQFCNTRATSVTQRLWCIRKDAVTSVSYMNAAPSQARAGCYVDDDFVDLITEDISFEA